LIALKNKKHFDIIICGGGAAGLLLAHGLIKNNTFDHLSIALIEKEQKNQNDRTWCFWEEGRGPWDHLVSSRWENAIFQSQQYNANFSLAPYQYKMIEGINFYNHLYPLLEKAPNLDLIQAEITEVNAHEKHTEVTTHKTSYTGDKVFSSIPNEEYKQQQKYPVLQQHFIGWFVKTEVPIFDKDTIVFMDFDLPQKNNTRFMYVLPFSPTEALVEYTLFSKDLLKDEEYKAEITQYLNQKKAGKVSVTATEKGSIPMTAYNFDQHNSAHLIHIGTAGGWTKASTGFTFQKSQEKINALIEFLKKGKALNQFPQRNKFNFYDMLFLDVLAKYNGEGSELFSGMFQRNTPQRIFQFLDEKTNYIQEVLLMSSFPVGRFVKALFKRIFSL
jgi:lycopene beta-cyclase